ncbi:MAG: protein phosphatase 2C domain-containing protein [Aestuariivirga sp.]|uniref:protein phosphatase 2C domain-containing protein n=1 Tax=Aestuariivirga sp. TaxID=2650926 RepID=UPI0025BEECE4|nr:protein phosphatase 2C domain-containing protein [Aestuariivirga sp.]MCA3561126.1 protein phosphatase 2C domain-containing protein [Aestuariivirga sp.]
MKLIGAVSEGSGATNEDGFGWLGTPDDVSAAWILDGVTGINRQNYLGEGTDARWLVAKAHARLAELAARGMPLPSLLEELVAGLIQDFEEASAGKAIPADYDPPAACLVLVKRYGNDWQALRLGDSCLLARDGAGQHRVHAASPNNVLDRWLTREAKKRRDAGMLDMKALLAEFAPRIKQGRAQRNRPGGYSILEARADALAMPEIIDLGRPDRILLCTDGYYRAADHYGLHDDEGLLEASLRGVDKVLAALRAAEAGDPDCSRYPRFKSADDATAVMLAR